VKSAPIRSLLAVVVAGVALSACGASAPPGRELAHEMIDTLKGDDGVPLSDEVKDCMHTKVDEFAVTDDEQTDDIKSLDDAAKAIDDDGTSTETRAKAQAIMDRFQAELASCR
jgi:hypothetical protein